MFIGAGGTDKGKGYPINNEKVAILNEKGSLSEIGNYLYTLSVLAATGLINGSSADVLTWNIASEFMTGKTITNPCQTSKPGQALSAACYSYLYNQSGCLAKGTYNPNTDVNKTYTQPSALQGARDQAVVSNFYALTKQTADNNGLTNKQREAAYLGCYGVQLLQI